MKKIAIFGAGGFGREVAMLVGQINAVKPEWVLVGFFDDGFGKGTLVNGLPVLGGVADINAYPEQLYLVVALGNPVAKKKIISLVTNEQIAYATLIHPNVQLGDSAWVTIGEGSIITAGCVITVNISIGRHVILNLGCTVGHDTVIGDYASFMPGVNISGEVIIEEGVYTGTGAKIINQLTIGSNTIVGAGAVVSRSLPASCTAVGIPAKPIKFHEEKATN